MEQVFRVILNISYTGGIVILAVLLLRMFLKKGPKWISYALWGVVLFRLVCPFSMESALALLPSVEPLPQEFLTAQTPEIHTGFAVLNSTVNPALAESMAPTPYASANPAQIALWIWGWIWALGMGGMLIYALCSTLRFYRRIRFSTLVEPGVYESDRIGTAFVYGIFQPKIYVPCGLSPEELSHVLLHERMHVRRLDHLWKPLSFLVLALHWFNPLVYIAYHCFGQDMELSCDERVLKSAGEDIRQAYSRTLLSVSVSRGTLVAPLAFGESNTRLRIRNVLQYKKPVFWIAVAGIALAAAAAVLLLLNPLSPALPVNTITETPITQAERETLSTLPEDTVYRYSYHVGPSVKSARLYVEGWREGVYQGAWGDYILPVDKRKGDITFSHEFSVGYILPVNQQEFPITGITRGIEWTVLDPSGAGVGFSAELPPDFNASSSAAAFLFSGKEEGTWPIRIYEDINPASSKSYLYSGREGATWPVAAAEPVILGAVAFATGDLIRSYDCQFLMENPDYIAKYEYVYLFKCVFSTKDLAELEAERDILLPSLDAASPLSPPPAPSASVPPAPSSTLSPDAAQEQSIVLIKDGKAARAVAIADDRDYQDLARRVIMDHMIRSAAWPAVDVETFEDRIEISTSIVEGEPVSTFYVFLQDGKPCMQSGNGMWTFMQEELYRELYAVASGETLSEIKG